MKHFVAIFLLLFSSALWADQLIIEPEMGRAPIIDAIKNTKHTLNLVMYGFTDEEILRSILKQSEHNTTKIILEESPYKTESENSNTIKSLKQHDIAWQGAIHPFRLIHQKTLISDGRLAIVMTFNFTHSTFKNERNFALIIDDAKKVNEIESVFSADWNHKTVSNHSPGLIYSPDDSREKIINLINSAHHQIRIYAQSISDYKIIGTLAKAARNGIKIEIQSSKNLREKQMNYLKRSGVNIHISKYLYIHAKVFIIDNQLAIIGSTNLTRASLDDNRELSVVTHDATIIKQLNKTFEKDWNDTTKTPYRHTAQLRKGDVIHAVKIINKYFNLLWQ